MEDHPTYKELVEKIARLEIALKEKEEEYYRLKRVFLSHVNHEIRTPMNSIIGFSSLLADSEISQEQKELYLTYINNSSENLLGIIENMIDMAMLEAGQVELCNSMVSLDDLFAELYARLSKIKHKREKHSVVLMLTRPADADEPEMVTDRYRLEQVLMNLAENALKFTDRGSIEIGYSLKNEQTIQFYVKDTGMGIESGSRQLIFESFRVGRKAEDTYIAGGGLGLSIVKSLVHLMDGEVWVESNQEQGSIFKIDLPLNKTEHNLEEAEKRVKRSFLDDLRQGNRHLAI